MEITHRKPSHSFFGKTSGLKTTLSSRTLIYKIIVKLYTLFKTQDCEKKNIPYSAVQTHL